MPFEECQPACDSAAMRAFPSLGLSKIVKHPQDKWLQHKQGMIINLNLQ